MVSHEDLAALQSYVTAKDTSLYSDLHEDTLMLDITHSNLKQRHIEIRFDKHTTISTLRDKIYQQTGTKPHFQHLQFLPNAGASQVLFDIPPNTDDNRMLGYYSLDHGVAVYCIDLDPHSGSKGGQYEDTSLVKKYKMSDEEYNKRQGTLRDWGRQQKEKDSSFTLAKHAKQHRELADANRQAKLGLDLPKGFEYGSNGKAVRVDNDEEDPAQTATENKENEFGIDTVEGIGAGMRCEVRPGTRRGAVAFVGEIPELGTGGYWIGIVFDEPVGKTDGTTKGGKRYFTAPGSNYGGFVRGKNVEIGDFPERDIMDELDDSDDEL